MKTNLAIVSEEYGEDAGLFDGGLAHVREALVSLFPDARLFILGRRRPPRSFLAAWRWALGVENLDLRGFDAVVSLTRGFAHGLVTQPFTRHTSYLFSEPALWQAPGLGGHWYRLWGRAASRRVDQWLVNSFWLKEALANHERLQATVVRPASPATNDHALRVSSQVGRPFVTVAAKRWHTAGSRAVAEACNKIMLPVVFLDSTYRHIEISTYRALLSEALFLIVPEPASFAPLVVEAFAAGKPVLGVRGGGLVEVIEEGVTGLFFDDAHPGVIADGIRRMRSGLGEFQPEVLRKKAEQFSFQRFREEFTKLVTGY